MLDREAHKNEDTPHKFEDTISKSIMKIFLYLGFLAALALGDPLEPRTYNLKVKIAIGLPTYDYELPTDVSSYLEGGMHDGLTTFLDENTAGILAAVEGTEGYSLDYVAVDSVDYPITCPAGYEAEPACGTFSFIVTITGPGGDPYEFASYLEAWLETVGLLVIKAKLENYYQAPYKLLKAYIYVIKGGGAMDDPHFLTWFGDWYGKDVHYEMRWPREGLRTHTLFLIHPYQTLWDSATSIC